jgi:hypothetical protein
MQMIMDQGSLSAGVTQTPNGEKLLRPVGQFECTVHQVATPRPEVSEDLAVELFAILGSALTALGVSVPAQDRALDRARQLSTPPRVSGPLLRHMRGLAEMLRAWSQEAGYVDQAGRARVLSIAGPGATFQSLAERFLPGVTLAAAVESLCARADVAIRPGNRIALLGGTLVNLADSPDHVLAHGIRQIDQLLATVLHNAATRRTGEGDGRTERMLLGVITRAEFDDLMRELRPQIAAFLERIESAVGPRRPKSSQALLDATAVSVGVYVSRDDDWERVGIDAATFVNPAPQEPNRR